MTHPQRETPPGQFDFGLSPAEEQRAASLHQQSIVFDFLTQHVGGTHIYEAITDALRPHLAETLRNAGEGWRIILAAAYWPYLLEIEEKSHVLRDWYFASGLTCGTYSVAVQETEDENSRWYADLIARTATLPWLRYVTTAAEIRQAKADGAIAFYGHWQPVQPLPISLPAIDRAYERGLRSLMLTYNRMDFVGVGCAERVDAGLSNYGVEVVRRCNDLGLIVDPSHCGHMTTMDACRTSKRPVTANHTCAKSVTDVARAKSDSAIKAIAGTGGVIGVVTVPFFISRQRRPTIEAMLDHIDYIARLVGWEHVAIGTDYPLQAPEAIAMKLTGPGLNRDLGFRPEDNLDPRDKTIGFEDYRDLPNITRGLVKRGYSDEAIAGILGENALRVFADVCG